MIQILLFACLQSPVKPELTVQATLQAMSKVPSVKTIAPYRKALVSADFTVERVISGSDPSVKPGSSIRVLVWGIVNGKPTAMASLKKNSKTRLSLVPLASWPAMDREYQVDDLPVGKSTKYFVEFTKSK